MTQKRISWTEKGATLSDNSAREEFGLTQKEIIQAIKQGKLQYKENHIHGNPYLRLLRFEVESLIGKKKGKTYLEKSKLEKELKEISKELRSLKIRTNKLEKQKNKTTVALECYLKA